MKQILKEVVKETIVDALAMRQQREEASWARYRAREEAMKTAGPFKKAGLATLTFLEEVGPALVPCAIILGAIAHAVYEVFFS